MKTRRGMTYHESDMGMLIDNFEPGDIVSPAFLDDSTFYGVVASIDRKANAVMVAWGGGAVSQHSPEEVLIYPKVSGDVKAAMARGASVRGRRGAQNSSQFVGDPETHGIDEPISGGFDVMRNLARRLHEESVEDADKGPLVDPMVATKTARSRRGVYYMQAPRVYRRTKNEQDGAPLRCPDCGCEGMEKQRFTQSRKLWVCHECGFKIPTDKIVDKPIEDEDPLFATARRGRMN